jgi:hypothetical protein
LSDRERMIGYNRTVKLAWLDETVDLVQSGLTDVEIYAALSDSLKEQLSVGSTAKRGSREKTITLLLKTWVRVPFPLRDLRDEALQMMPALRRAERVSLHWGMTMAVYPFWRVVAEVTGRLFRLQGTASPMQVQRRVKELLGEREVVARSTRYVLRAFADWGVILEGETGGEYRPVMAKAITDPKMAAWLLEATVLSAPEGVADFNALLNAPCLFPFQIARISTGQLAASGRLEAVRHSLEDTLIRVKKGASPSAKPPTGDRPVPRN